jgi:hypothetical protein
MEQTALCQALERIETALARVEAAALHSAGLRTRHEKLKATIEKSLDALDDLIAKQDR